MCRETGYRQNSAPKSKMTEIDGLRSYNHTFKTRDSPVPPTRVRSVTVRGKSPAVMLHRGVSRDLYDLAYLVVRCIKRTVILQAVLLHPDEHKRVWLFIWHRSSRGILSWFEDMHSWIALLWGKCKSNFYSRIPQLRILETSLGFVQVGHSNMEYEKYYFCKKWFTGHKSAQLFRMIRRKHVHLTPKSRRN